MLRYAELCYALLGYVELSSVVISSAMLGTARLERVVQILSPVLCWWILQFWRSGCQSELTRHR